MEEHLIFLIDILGFSHAVSTWDEEKKAKLIELARAFASLRSDSAFALTPTSEGQSQVNIPPAITTFSDLIVVSHPMRNLESLPGTIPLQMGLHLVKPLIAALAAEAAKLGLLIRGGATVGPLYHARGVVLGEAMNEAYKLESSVAIYPRIAISRKVYSQIGPLASLALLPKDDDGITHLNYFQEMITRGGNPPGPDYGPRLRAWFAEVQRSIAENIVQFERDEDWKKLAKWTWFKRHLEQARATLPPIFFEEPKLPS